MHFPTASSRAVRTTPFPRTRSDFVRNRVLSAPFFWRMSAFCTVFVHQFCVFIQSTPPVRTEFPLHSVQNIRKSTRHFLFVHRPKALYFLTHGGSKKAPLGLKGSWRVAPEGIRMLQISKRSEPCSISPPSFADANATSPYRAGHDKGRL